MSIDRRTLLKGAAAVAAVAAAPASAVAVDVGGVAVDAVASEVPLYGIRFYDAAGRIVMSIADGAMTLYDDEKPSLVMGHLDRP